MIVMKFGGTSMEDAAAIFAARDRVRERLDRSPFVVVSACAGVTSALLAATEHAAQGRIPSALEILSSLLTRHRTIADQLLRSQSGRFRDLLEKDGEDLSGIIRSIALLREASARTVDFVVAHGELWSSRLLSGAIGEAGIPVTLLPAAELLLTDDHYGHANPLLTESAERIRKKVFDDRSMRTVIVTQGFIGSTRDGSTTTIGRGGSDFSASIFGAALDVEEIEIWTDVNGVLSADPAVVPTAVPLDTITFEEQTELSHYGARVLHPSTLLPAMESNIPVRVLNSRDPSFHGTVINTRGDQRKGVSSISSKRGLSVVSVRGRKDSRRRTLLAEFLNLLADRGRDIEFLVNSEAGISFISDDGENDVLLLQRLVGGDRISLQPRKAIVCIVGENIRDQRKIRTMAYETLAEEGIHVDSVFDGASSHSLVFLVQEETAVSAVRALHQTFFGTVALEQRVA